MARIGVKQNSGYMFDEAEDENHLTSNCTAIPEIRAKHVGKNVIDDCGDILSEAIIATTVY